MTSEEFKSIREGTAVRISTNPEISIRKYMGREAKRVMAGSIKRVAIKGNNFVKIRYNEDGFSGHWTFDVEDISLVDTEDVNDNIKPVLFKIRDLYI